MRNPWDYPPTDGFTDTYEYSKGLQDDLNYLQKGYMNKNITSFDDSSLIDEGIGDYLAGTESYAMRYFQGQLISNQIVGFNKINGSEGLLATIGEKIKQFFKWIASLFTKDKNESLTKVAPPPTPSLKGAKLDTKKIEALMDQMKVMKEHWKNNAQLYINSNEHLAEVTEKLKEEFPSAYAGVKNLQTNKFNEAVGHVTSHLDGLADTIASFTNSDQLVAYTKGKQVMLWNAFIAVFDNRVKIDVLDAIKGISESNYETVMKGRISGIKEESDQKRVMDNLVAISRFTAKLVSVRNMTDELWNIRTKVNDNYYSVKS